MGLTSIKASKKVNDEDRVAEVLYDFGDTLAKSVEMFGEDVVFTNFKRTATIVAQAAMRRSLEGGKSQEEITALMKGWRPGVALERIIDPVASLVGKWDSYTEAEQEDILKKLKKKKSK